MSCDGKERKTFQNVRRLAELSKRLTGERQVIYRERGRDTYAFCPEGCYSEERGEFAARL